MAAPALDEIFVRIPEGWFAMGSDDGPAEEAPVHRVWVDAFDLAVYPVTCRAYARFLHASGHEAPRAWSHFSMIPERPVVGVRWHDCQAYCRWRASQGTPVRLATEAEWERAARGGIDGQRYPWGDAIPTWIPRDGRGPLEAPWPVTLGEPNAFGLFGIAGNVHEWCADWYASDYYRDSAAASRPDRLPACAARRAAGRGGTRSPSAAARRGAGSTPPFATPTTASASFASSREAREGNHCRIASHAQQAARGPSGEDGCVEWWRRRESTSDL